MKPNCGYCGGPLFRGVCMCGHANKRTRDNAQPRTRPANPAVSSYTLSWRTVFTNSHGNPTRTAQLRPVVIASNGLERLPPNLPGSVTRY